MCVCVCVYSLIKQKDIEKKQPLIKLDRYVMKYLEYVDMK